MTNQQLQNILRKYPLGIEVKLCQGWKKSKKYKGNAIEPNIHDFDEENILDTREEFTDQDGEEHPYNEDGYILINPPIQ